MRLSMFEDIPVDVGIIYEGERIRWTDTHMELGGPRVEHKFELVRVKALDEIEDGKITIIGPDIKDMKQQGYPFGIYIEVAGKELEEDLEGVFERHVHEYVNFVEGFMHVGGLEVSPERLPRPPFPPFPEGTLEVLGRGRVLNGGKPDAVRAPLEPSDRGSVRIRREDSRLPAVLGEVFHHGRHSVRNPLEVRPVGHDGAEEERRHEGGIG